MLHISRHNLISFNSIRYELAHMRTVRNTDIEIDTKIMNLTKRRGSSAKQGGIRNVSYLDDLLLKRPISKGGHICHSISKAIPYYPGCRSLPGRSSQLEGPEVVRSWERVNKYRV